MDPFHHLNTAFSNPYHPLLSSSPPHPYHPPPPLPPPPAADPPERERLPQWSHAETAAFLAIRADLDHSFLSTKRNKALWEAVSARLNAQGGFARTPDQCKSKWKNLVTRFKGTASDAQPEGGDHPAGAAARGSFPGRRGRDRRGRGGAAGVHAAADGDGGAVDGGRGGARRRAPGARGGVARRHGRARRGAARARAPLARARGRVEGARRGA
uniref:Myb-like domain-containing protein n=1 Tax=Aegilops tauschii subsp. strangulata TaxID=200361 RepID=A0A452XUX4_AEGTS